MKNLTLEKISQVCNGKLFCNDESLRKTEVEGIVRDTNDVKKDYLFIAIRGGHNYVNVAYENGAMCVISEKELDTDKPYILVEDSLIATKDIARYYRSILDIKVVGVTGSVGKTSSKEAIASVLSEKYNTLKTDGNYNNELGVPLTIFRLREEHEVAVIEMGISDFNEMTRLTDIVKPDVCVITNIGTCHLEKLGDRDGVLKAKTEIFKGLNKNGHIVLNGDDDKLITIKEYEGIKPVFYSYEKKDGVIAYSENVKTDDVDSVSCNIIYDNEKMDVNIKIPGKHMIYNALAATCVGKIFDLTNEEIISGLGKVTAISGRGNVIRKNNITLIDDCYNANPVSMRAGIDVLCFGKGRKVAILGDMFELGNDEKKFHAEIGEYTKKKDIDVLVFVGELMLNAFMTFKSDECPEKELYYYNTLSDFLSECKDILKDGDVVLIKASNGMKFKEIKEFLLG